ncbi:MAG TPA: prephenate dehydratase [Thermomicrobiales bacterium]|jgi:prephenate dehydratase|nr:prephenate dehydratase [Thermomicrobiales bacterium]
MATAFLGPKGSFSEDATRLLVLRRRGSTGVTVAEALVGHEEPTDLLPFASIPALTAAVETGLAEDALLPIENSLEGAVSATLDLLIHETTLKITGEIVLPVRHDLITVPGATLADIKVVSSHPQGLGQTRRFLDRCLPGVEQVAALSTSGAVQEITRAGDPSRAAIGTARAAELYGGVVLAHDIQDVRANVTRFVALSHTDAAPTGNDKTSLGFTTRSDVPGILHRALGAFAAEGLQLTKIESRPAKAWLGEYVFLVDLEGHREDEPVRRALDALSGIAANVMIFGSYPRFPVDALREVVDPKR